MNKQNIVKYNIYFSVFSYELTNNNMDSTIKKKRKVVRRLKPPPPINTLQDLIHIGQSNTRYSNINNEMLWRILPILIELEMMIGMVELKRTILHQIVFYLQDLFINNDNDFLHTVILGSPGTGKCLGKDTPIIMHDGNTLLVQDIKVGDQIMGDDSTPRTILSLSQGSEMMYRIQNKYSVNKSHIISLISTNGKFVDISISEYIKKEQHWKDRHQMYRVSIVFPHIEPKCDPYICGFFLVHNCSTFNLTTYTTIYDKEVLEYCESFDIMDNVSRGVFQLDLEYFDEYPNIMTQSIPNDFKINSPSVIKQFLGGIYDSIGKLTDDGGIEIYINGGDEYIKDIIWIHNILGLDYTLKNSEYSLQTTRDVYVDRISTITVKDVSTIYSIKRKHKCDLDDTTRQIVKQPVIIEPLTVGDYYGFEIDGNHRFVLEDCTVTHNTTIAKIIGEMYKEMGVLSNNSGIFKVAKRDDFVAEFLGQTAIKTRKLLESCIGGVLFIDEVYALGPGEGDTDSFSKEAIDTLNAFLSENAHSFCCIIAGYEEEVKRCFFSVNKGLERRFQWVHKIQSYTEEELSMIFFKILASNGWETNIDIAYISKWIKKSPALFKNFGGDMQNLVFKCKITHAQRIISEVKPQRFMITTTDFDNAVGLLKPHQLQEDEDTGRYLPMYM